MTRSQFLLALSGAAILDKVDTRVQFTEAGAFGADSNFHWNQTQPIYLKKGSTFLCVKYTEPSEQLDPQWRKK